MQVKDGSRHVRILCVFIMSPDSLRVYLYYDGCQIYNGHLEKDLQYLNIPASNGRYIIESLDDATLKCIYVTDDGRYEPI